MLLTKKKLKNLKSEIEHFFQEDLKLINANNFNISENLILNQLLEKRINYHNITISNLNELDRLLTENDNADINISGNNLIMYKNLLNYKKNVLNIMNKYKNKNTSSKDIIGYIIDNSAKKVSTKKKKSKEIESAKIKTNKFFLPDTPENVRNIKKRNKYTKKITEFINKNNRKSKLTNISSNDSLKDIKTTDDNKIFSVNKKLLNYVEGEREWCFSLQVLKFPLQNFYIHKAFYKFYDEELNELNLNDLSCQVSLNSTVNNCKFDYKLLYNSDSFNSKKVYIFIFFISVNINKYKILQKPILWGFSFLQLRSEGVNNKSIISGHFELPVYNTIYLKMNKDKLKQILERYPNYISLKRIPVSSILCCNLLVNKMNETNYSEKDYINNIYINNNFSPSDSEILYMKYLDSLKDKTHNFIISNLFSGIFNEHLTYDEYFDYFIQFSDCLLYNYPIITNNKSKNIKKKIKKHYNSFTENKINIEINGIFNCPTEDSYLISAYIVKFDENLNYKLELFFVYNINNINEENNYIKFRNNIFNIEKINSKDFIIFKIYRLTKAYQKVFYGFSLLPLFTYRINVINGLFAIPVIKNKIKKSFIELIKVKSIWTYLNNIANGNLENVLTFSTSVLIINIENPNFMDNIYTYNNYNINFMFMPLRFINMLKVLLYFDKLSKYDDNKIKHSKEMKQFISKIIEIKSNKLNSVT